MLPSRHYPWEFALVEGAKSYMHPMYRGLLHLSYWIMWVVLVVIGRMGCQQYKLVEMKLLAQQRDLQAKLPDIEKCLDIVATLQGKKGSGEVRCLTQLILLTTLRRHIYSRAQIENTESVCLWLGANVMLEYSCEEATVLLQKNLENARASLEVLVADLQFLRDQVTIPQVTIARVYNWDVHQKRIRQGGAPAKDS
ncbi:hypothetical protein ACJRO7_020685 [Eucalyptus globulus]|uniref:Prefoldin subunit 3 n=1 Tax=Eucalyptus globulus TaxID=34317 RepID=A0ABD3KM99_EUCGL